MAGGFFLGGGAPSPIFSSSHDSSSLGKSRLPHEFQLSLFEKLGHPLIKNQMRLLMREKVWFCPSFYPYPKVYPKESTNYGQILSGCRAKINMALLKVMAHKK